MLALFACQVSRTTDAGGCRPPGTPAESSTIWTMNDDYIEDEELEDDEDDDEELVPRDVFVSMAFG